MAAAHWLGRMESKEDSPFVACHVAIELGLSFEEAFYILTETDAMNWTWDEDELLAWCERQGELDEGTVSGDLARYIRELQAGRAEAA